MGGLFSLASCYSVALLPFALLAGGGISLHSLTPGGIPILLLVLSADTNRQRMKFYVLFAWFCDVI